MKNEYSTKTKDPRQASLPLSATEGTGPDKNLLMEYIEKKPIGTVVIPSRFNPVGDRSDA